MAGNRYGIISFSRGEDRYSGKDIRMPAVKGYSVCPFSEEYPINSDNLSDGIKLGIQAFELMDSGEIPSR